MEIARSGRNEPWRKWYGSKRWKSVARDQLNRFPVCRMCHEEGIVSSANTVDHVIPHRGDEVKFWFGELQSLCPRCHSSAKQREESGSVQQLDEEGWPL